MKRFSGVAAVVVLLAAGSASFSKAPATASSASGTYVALGDSFSAGEGVPDFFGPMPPIFKDSKADGCHRSKAAYSTIVRHTSGTPNNFSFVACSGAKTDNFYSGQNGEPAQLNALDSTTELVTLTAGGNDIGFEGLIVDCIDPTTNCRRGLGGVLANQGLRSLPGKLSKLYQDVGIRSRNAIGRIFVLDYPRVFPSTPTHSCVGFSIDDQNFVNDIAARLDAIIKTSASNAGMKFVEVKDAFNKHELCSNSSTPYVNGFIPSHHEFSFHPNAAGQGAFANAVNDALRSSPPPPVSGSKVDLVFAIDTTGSMSGYIQGVVNVANDVVTRLASKGIDYRIGLVDYKDADNCGNYDAVTDLTFTSNKSAIAGAIGALPAKVGGGCDTPEDVYSGLMRAIGFPWRNGVTKAIIVMGDAPPKDPEPHTGFTSASVASAARAVDPASIYPILVGGDGAATAAFTSLATETGGKTFDSNATDVSQAVLDAINVIIDSAVPCTNTITGERSGALVIGAGKTCVSNAHIGGTVIVPKGAAIDVENSRIDGGISASGPSDVRLCGNTIGGGVTVNSAVGFVLIGDAIDDGCATNKLGGALVLENNRHGLDAIDNLVAGQVTIVGNAGTGPFPEDAAPDVSGNGPSLPKASSSAQRVPGPPRATLSRGQIVGAQAPARAAR